MTLCSDILSVYGRAFNELMIIKLRQVPCLWLSLTEFSENLAEMQLNFTDMMARIYCLSLPQKLLGPARTVYNTQCPLALLPQCQNKPQPYILRKPSPATHLPL